MAIAKGPRPGGTVERIIRLHRRGLVPRQIAEEIGTTPGHVRTALSRNGHRPHRLPIVPTELAGLETIADTDEARPTTEQNATALWNYFDDRRRALQKEVAYWKARATTAQQREPQ